MPSTVIHLCYALFYGFALYALTEGKFSVLRIVVLALGATNGPDAGPVLEALLASVPIVGTTIMDVVHKPYGFPLTLGILYAVAVSWASSFSVVWQRGAFKLRLERGGRRLERWRAWFLILAGCLLHFQLDVPFEENGHDVIYMWILSTGYWHAKEGENPNQVTPLLVLVFVLVIFGTIAGLVKIWMREEGQVLLEPNWTRLFQTLKLLAYISTAYLLFIATRTFTVPKIPAVGEEADFGVGVFVLVFQLAPMYLCWASFWLGDDFTQQVPLSVQSWIV